MAGVPFASFAPNGEDVVLWRALGSVVDGHYIDIGAHHPGNGSISRAFYDHGWRGITVEPLPDLADLLRQERPGDVVIEAVGRGGQGEGATLDDVLGGAGWSGEDIHFLSIDAAGSETEVLQSIDLPRRRPWVLVVRAVAGDSNPSPHQNWEELVSGAGYRFCLFDGLARFYVAVERDNEIGTQLGTPANSGDNFTTLQHREMAKELEEAGALRNAAIQQSIKWRTVALERWNDLMEVSSVAAGRMADENLRLYQENVALQSTLSWRVTRPLRAIRERFPRTKEGE